MVVTGVIPWERLWFLEADLAFCNTVLSYCTNILCLNSFIFLDAQISSLPILYVCVCVYISFSFLVASFMTFSSMLKNSRDSE